MSTDNNQAIDSPVIPVVTPAGDDALRQFLVRMISTPRVIPQSLLDDASRRAQRLIDEDATKTAERAPLWLVQFWQTLASGAPPFGYIVLTDKEYREQGHAHYALLTRLL